jgi:hypothetical protein
MANDYYISRIGYVEHNALKSNMSMSNCFVLLWIPVRIILLVLTSLTILYEVLEHISCVLKPIFEDISAPIVRPSFISVDDMDEYLQLRLISVVFDNLDGLRLRNIFILD